MAFRIYTELDGQYVVMVQTDEALEEYEAVPRPPQDPRLVDSALVKVHIAGNGFNGSGQVPLHGYDVPLFRVGLNEGVIAFEPM
jgi:hypothetical protein